MTRCLGGRTARTDQPLAALTSGLSAAWPRAFLMQPGPGTGPIQCVLTRARRGAKLFPEYALHLELGGRFLLAARKRRKSAGAHYLLSRNGQARARHGRVASPSASAYPLHGVPGDPRHLHADQPAVCGVCGRTPPSKGMHSLSWSPAGQEAAWLLQVTRMPAEAASHVHATGPAKLGNPQAAHSAWPAQDLSRGGDSFCGKVRANFVGTEFVFYDRGAKPGGVDLAPGAPPFPITPA